MAGFHEMLAALKPVQKLPSSFRDPSGFLFTENGVLYRQVNAVYRKHFDSLRNSGLYDELVQEGLLIAHREVTDKKAEGAYKILQPEKLPFISYPYEWSFSQLKDAALATLRIQKKALARGMILKDASAYNIQFKGGKPVLIDTLSFEIYGEGKPWPAYRQFCQHFLAPLALMSHADVRLGLLLRDFIDGVPLDLASRLLPKSTWLRFSLLTHIHLHAFAQQKSPPPPAICTRYSVPGTNRFGRQALAGLIDSLESAVQKLKWNPRGTVWSDYYGDTNYSKEAFEEKKRVVSDWIGQARPASVWDFGANTGIFSRLASGRGIFTAAFDADPAAVEKNYREAKKEGDAHLLPFWMDLANPSPALGWASEERDSLAARGPADLGLALALVHHLAIANNVPLELIAAWFAGLCRNLIVEFVPKEDSQIRRLLASREDIFPDYTEAGFEAAFGAHFALHEKREIAGTRRVLYWYRKSP